MGSESDSTSTAWPPGVAALSVLRVVLAGAVVATLAPVAVFAVVAVVITGWALIDVGAGESLVVLSEAGAFVGLAGAVTMTGVYVVGIPVALMTERCARQRPELRLLVYGVAGAVPGVVVAVVVSDGSAARVSLAALFGGVGLIAALSGAGAMRRAGHRPVGPVRRFGEVGTFVLIAATAIGWIATGAVLIPLIVAAVSSSFVAVVVALMARRFVVPGT